MIKRTKNYVHYGHGTMSEHCSVCRHFEPPHACERVEGRIDPTGWCNLFARITADASGKDAR